MTCNLTAAIAATVLVATVAVAASADQSAMKNPLSSGEVFYTGCNYWA